MRESGAIVAGTLKYLASILRPGCTTGYLDAKAEEYIRAHGAIPSFKGYRGYKHATCLSVNEQVVHGIPGHRELLPGDIIGVDVGAQLNGFHADSAVTLPVGEISAEAGRLMQATSEGLAAGLAMVKAGRKLGAVSNAIESVAKKYGYGVVRDLFGHGVGRNLHEDPLIPNFGPKNQGPELKSGMTLAIEPMFNAGTHEILTLDDGWTVVTADATLSAHFEHTVVVTDSGCEVLTKI